MDGFAALTQARDVFDRNLASVQERQWSLATQCTDWDVRALVNHVVGGARRYVLLLHGAGPGEVDATRTVDHLGRDPVILFRTIDDEVTTALREPGALARVVRHPAGDRGGSDLPDMRVVELAVHGWDLAAVIGTEEHLAPDLVEFLLALTPVYEDAQRAGLLKSRPVPTDEGLEPQVRLLNMLGRSA